MLIHVQSCAATLAQHPDKFKVTIIERMAVTGGQATSISLDKEKYGTDWMNDGVQGGSPISVTKSRTHDDILTHHRYSNTLSTFSDSTAMSLKKSSSK